MRKIWEFIKRHKIITGIILLVVLFIGFRIFKGGAQPAQEVATVSRKDVVQEVELTGRVQPSEKIDLAVETGGKVRSIPVKVGDPVKAGQTLLKVDDSDLQIRLGKQQSVLRKAQLALDDLNSGGLSRTKAENGLSNAQDAYQAALDNLNKAHEDGFNDVSDAFLDLPGIVDEVDDIFAQSYLSQSNVRSVYGKTADDYRESAEAKILDAEKLFEDNQKKYRATDRDSDPSVIEELIVQTYDTTNAVADGVKALKNLLDYIDGKTADNSKPTHLADDQASMTEFTAELNGHSQAILAVNNSIKTSKNTIASSGRSVQEGSQNVEGVGEDVERAQLDVQDAQLDIQQTSIDIGKRTIKSPIDGVVTDIVPSVGETAAPGSPSVSVISTNQYEIEANLAEADLAKVKLAAEADVTLDSYGTDTVFKAAVSFINPAEDIIDGVATYRIKLQFAAADDRVKSGMTANVTIKGERKDGVIAIPQRAVISKNGGKYVRVQEGETVVEKQVETGLRGSDGNVEITQGLSEGEKIIVFSDGE
jgi:multidrug efflux pump subunit AcrA (membrane-fusion protein)